MSIPGDSPAFLFEDRQTPGDWHVQWTDDEGGFEMAIFSGPRARERAIIFAERCYGSYEQVRSNQRCALGEMNMTNAAVRELYESENGDRWFLARDTHSGRVFVRHEPNLPSGGRPSDIELHDFLRKGAAGPEHQELIRLIGSLIEHRASSKPLSG